jgi:hypothetical protein
VITREVRIRFRLNDPRNERMVMLNHISPSVPLLLPHQLAGMPQDVQPGPQKLRNEAIFKLPHLDPHRLLQDFARHWNVFEDFRPFLRKVLRPYHQWFHAREKGGGKMLRVGNS